MFSFRMWRRTGDGPDWVPGTGLSVELSDGTGIVPEQLSWVAEDGAEFALGFSPEMTTCFGHHRTADGDVVELRGELDDRRRQGDAERAGDVRCYEFDTEAQDASGRHPTGPLRLLIDDGGEAPVRSATWRDRSGDSFSIALRSASLSGNADVTDLVTAVWASAEHRDAGEVAANLTEASAGKWFAPHEHASLEFRLSKPIAVEQYVLTSADDAPDRDPGTWTLRGSADGNLWQTLDIRTHQSFAGRHRSNTYRIAQPRPYELYRLDIRGNNGSPHLQLQAVRFLAGGSGFVGYRRRAGHAPVAWRGTRRMHEPSPDSMEPLPYELPDRRMRRMVLFRPLHAEAEVVSPSGTYTLRYDPAGVAVVVERGTGLVVWRAGDDERNPAAGELVLSGSLQVRLSGGGVWRSSVAAEGARFLTVTDDGELELLDDIEVSLFNSRQGFIGSRPAFEGSAPVAEITLKRYLYRKNKKGVVTHTVKRKPDGSLWVTVRNMSYPMGTAALARWLEQDDTALTWRRPPSSDRATDEELCLIDAAGNPLWREGTATTTPPLAEPHDHGGQVLGLGSRLCRQSLTSPSGSHTLLHRGDGSLVLYCDAAHAAVWTTGTDWLGESRLDLTPQGDLVLRTSCGAPVWRSETAGKGVEQLAVRDDGSLVLSDGAGETVWGINDHAPCTAAGRSTPRGAVLRRGQTLRNQSLTSADGDTVLCHQPGPGTALFRPDDWVDLIAAGAELSLDDEGFLNTRDEDGRVLEQIAGPGDHLVVVSGGEVRLCAEDGTVMWRAGQYVLDSPEALTGECPRPVPAAALEALCNAHPTAIVRTAFSDDDAWAAAWRDIAMPREYWDDDDLVLRGTLVARPEFEGWSGEDLASLLSQTPEHDFVFVVDAVTLASPEHPVLVVEVDAERERPRFFRAVPHVLLDVETQLSISNLDWEDFSEAVDPDGVLRESSAD